MAKAQSSKRKELRGRQAEIRDSSPAAKAKFAVVEAKAKRIVERLRKHHEMGQDANQLQAKQPISTVELAEKKQLDPGTLRRSKMFAKLYSSESGSGRGGLSEFQELCSLRRPTGLPLHWGYVPYLMTIKSRKKRREIAAKAASQGWSPARLHAEIRQIEDRPPGHGRSVELPATTADATLQVVREGRLWLSRAKKLVAVFSSQKEGKPKSSLNNSGTEQAELTNLFNQVSTECARLTEMVGMSKTSPSQSTAKPRRDKASKPEGPK